jgi:hypothetical protein
MRKIALAAGAAVALLTGVATAQADQGLNGAYYQFNTSPGSVANAESLIASSGGPAATFTANTVCFPSCGNTIGDGGALADFLGGNASNISSNSITDLSDHAIVLTGQIDLTQGEQLSLGSDDGSALWINGAMLIDNDGDHGFGSASATYTGQSGWQTIEILQFEDGGVTGLSVNANTGAGGDWVALGGDAISTGAVPEPSTWAMMALGFAGLGYAGFRTSRKAAAAA